MKERRDLAKAEGRCGTCRKNKPEPGYVTCVGCLACAAKVHRRLRREHHAKRYGVATGFHACCQSFGDHRFDCREIDVRAKPYLRRAA